MLIVMGPLVAWGLLRKGKKEAVGGRKGRREKGRRKKEGKKETTEC